MAVATECGALGGFADLLHYRLTRIDLDATVFGAVGFIRAVRSELMPNIAILCFAGAAEMHDAARLVRADRFSAGEEIAEKVYATCEQLGWGG